MDVHFLRTCLSLRWTEGAQNVKPYDHLHQMRSLEIFGHGALSKSLVHGEKKKEEKKCPVSAQ